MKKNVLKDFALLLGLVIFVSLIARFMARGETLDEYNKKKSSSEAASVVSTESAAIAESVAEVNADSIDTKSENKDSSNTTAVNNSSKGSAPENDNSSNASSGTAVSTNVSSNGPESKEISEKVSYMDEFYYEPLSSDIIQKITGVSYVDNDNISLDDLRYCHLLYIDFEGNTQTGEMICNKKIAQDVIEIFYELYSSGYQIESIKLIDEFDGDDTASMLANNTSCFNYRVVDNTTRLSNHAYGLAIDLNPFYNPYITYGKDGSVHVSPEGSEVYADRTQPFPYKIDENDLAYKLFKAHGFKWGGDWNSVKDYQHFERSN